MTGGPSRARAVSLVRALVWFVVSYGLAIVGYAATNFVAGRWFGREGYGLFVVLVTVSAAVGQLGLLGTHRGGLRAAARLDDDDAQDETLLQLRRDAAVASRLSLPLAGLVAGAVTYAVIGGDRESRIAIAVGFVLLVVLSGLQKLWANYLRGLGRVRLASLLEGRSGGALVSFGQALLLLLAWQLVPDLGLAAAVGALVVGFAVPVVASGWIVARHWTHLRVSELQLLRSLPDAVRRNWRFAVNQLALYIAGAVEIWIAGLVLSKAGASEFAAAQRMALLLVIPLTSIQVVFAPVAARLLGRGEHARLEQVLRTGATLATAGTSFLWVPMLAVPGWLLGALYGSEFSGAALALFLLTLGNVVYVLTGLCGVSLVMSQHEGTVATTQLISSLARVGLGVASAAVFGVVGLAATSAAITAVTYLVLFVQARRLLGLWTHPTLRPHWGVLRRTRS